MKRLFKLMVLPALMLGAAACSSEIDVPEGGEGNQGQEFKGEKFYVSFDITNAAPTRSQTKPEGGSTDGEELGKDKENKVNTILLVAIKPLGTNDTNGNPRYQYISSTTAGQGQAQDLMVQANNNYTIFFESQNFNNVKNTDVNILAFVNMAKDVVIPATLQSGDDFPMDIVPTLTLPSEWGAGQFMMTNANSKSFHVPDDLTPYNSIDNAFNITKDGPIEVERLCARFDFQTTTKEGFAVNTYPIYDGEDVTATIELKDMAMLNVSKKCFVIRRISSTGENKNVTYLGKEIYAANHTTHGESCCFVVDDDWEVKKQFGSDSFTPTQDWKNSYVNLYETANWLPTGSDAWTSLANWDTTHEDDNTTPWKHKGDYKIWDYVFPNTILGPATERQMKGVTTGIVFRGAIQAPAGSALETSMKTTHADVFVFENKLLGTWADITKLVAETKVSTDADVKNKNNSIVIAYDQIVADVKAEAGVEDAATADAQIIRKHAVAQKFIAYTYDATLNYYPVYYYYWNRHNDNGNDTVMGDMEFAVVRNNVYKLDVEVISRFGHPANPNDEPDDNHEDPDDPDEDGKIYFKVNVHVLPWVVRLNHIVFK